MGAAVPGYARAEVTLADLMALLRRRRRLMFGIVFGFLGAATLYCSIAQRRYEASGQIQIEKEDSSQLSRLNGTLSREQNTASDALDFNTTMQTEADILKSDTLALQVIKELKLETTEDFFPASATGRPGFGAASFLPWVKPLEPLTVAIDDAPNRRDLALKKFSRHLKIEPVAGTRLIGIRYSDRDPVRAAAVVNHLIAALTSYTFQSRLLATEQISTWLGGEMGNLKSQAEALEAKTVDLQRQTGIYGSGESNNLTLTRLESLSNALAMAESNRILKGAVAQAAQNGDPEMLSGLAGNTPVGSPGSSSDAFALLHSLRSQEAAIRSKLSEDEVRYGPAYPRIAEMHAQLENIQRAIREETARIGQRAQSDYEVAVKAEAAARQAFEEQKKTADRLSDKAVALTLTRQEAEDSRNLYGNLYGSLKQAGVLSGLRSSNITVVSPSRVPPPNAPRHPNIPVVYVAALVGGVFFGVAGAFVRDATDPTVRSLVTIEATLGGAMLAVLPGFRRGRSFALPRKLSIPRLRKNFAQSCDASVPQALTHPESAFSEAIRALRTSIVLSGDGKPPKVILVTSSLSAEGKSTVSVNLAVALAQSGGRTLLVDGDLRRPTIDRLLGLPEGSGLSTALSDHGAPDEWQPIEELPQLAVITAGRIPLQPAELVGSSRMVEMFVGWRARFDFIVVDSPPLLPVADALLLAQEADACLLVIRHAATARQAVEKSFRSLQRHLPAAVKVGVVLNGVSDKSGEYYDYYGYRGPYRAADSTQGVPYA